MMTFKKIGGTFKAINSLKPVNISNDWKDQWMVFMPEGGLLNNFTSAGPFVDFSSARKYAEMNVGMKMNWSDF